MKKKNLYKLKPKMILGEDIINKDGRLLFPKGFTITKKEIRILKMWGIIEAKIQSVPSSGKEKSANDKTLNSEAIEEHLIQRFRHNPLNHPVVSTVYQLCVDRQKERTDNNELKIKDSLVKDDQSSKKSIAPIKDLKKFFKEGIELPALPTIFAEINEAIKNPRCSGKDIADIVSKDTSLTAKLLKIINSAYYGMNKKVESLSYAAMALGTQQISSLAVGITMINYFKGIPTKYISMQEFWKHSVACAICARMLATHLDDVNSERVFIGALLHDIGRLILLKYYPEESTWLLSYCEKKNEMIHKAEPAIFGLTHAAIGCLLTETWHFSSAISDLILHHHDEFNEPPAKEVAVVHFSNWLVHALEIGSSGENVIPRLDNNAWKALNVSVSILEQIIKQIDRQIIEAVKFFYE